LARLTAASGAPADLIERYADAVVGGEAWHCEALSLRRADTQRQRSFSPPQSPLS